MADSELLDSRLRALCERRFELAVRAQEIYLEVSRVDLDIVRAGVTPPSEAIAGTIGATMIASFGGTIGATALVPAARTFAAVAAPIAGTGRTPIETK